MDNKFPSKYSNGKEVSAAQFITEIICERKAVLSKEDLHYRFWTQKKWASFYRNQIGSAHKLLKKHNAKAIIRALNTNQGKKIYSLRAPHLPAMIEHEQSLIDKENVNITIDINRNDDIKFRQASKSKNIISRLKDLE